MDVPATVTASAVSGFMGATAGGAVSPGSSLLAPKAGLRRAIKPIAMTMAQQ